MVKTGKVGVCMLKVEGEKKKLGILKGSLQEATPGASLENN